jgi:hypothetical protein
MPRKDQCHLHKRIQCIFCQTVFLHHADKYHRFTRPTVTGSQRPRREGAHGLPVTLSPRMTPRRRACGRTSPAQAPSLAASHLHCLLTPPLVAATAARGTAASLSRSTRDRSAPPPSQVSEAASIWRCRCRASLRVGATAGVRRCAVSRNYGSAIQVMLASAYLPRNTLNINVVYTGKCGQSITCLSLPRNFGVCASMISEDQLN